MIDTQVYHPAGPQVPDHRCEPRIEAICACCGVTLAYCMVTEADIRDQLARRWRCDVCLEDCKGRPPL